MILIDTNIWIYSYLKDGTLSDKATQIIESCILTNRALISTQNLLEFYSVVTRKYRQPVSEVNEFLTLLIESGAVKIVSPSEKAYKNAIAIASSNSMIGPKIFDVLISETAIENSVETIYTENVTDFICNGIDVINPLI